ncbi:MAG: hypothetical protein MRY78_20365 [Saprospiraceae bacterium]|nr:hypothetical protein [Saprospiraceae bacterium]
MKRFVLLVFALSFGLLVNLSAQEKDILDVFAQETCDCISKKNIESLSQEQINLELGYCIMQSLSKHTGEYEDKYEVDPSNPQSFSKFGEKIGFRMAATCPAILQKVATVGNADQTDAKRVVSEMVGTVKAIRGTDINFLVIKDEQGRDQTFVWLRYFNGSDLLMDDVEELVGQKVKVTYSLIELYSPKAKDYYNQKEIKGIQLL